ncbi:tRNA (adenosine(37)-N6)-dimethylallyltransferase MiaA [Algicella marina]|uniref:tRNA dimethylallyltransferase n=1 Tax=Algicella marina TaxID=2683284 RepID=A0A6P1T017_9RHOB|nr:tRNA (adenosine(37)-N6)-dimethylallyltransferase MiaA [Algicella marina]QHQ34796.1 tRNA (adenosine(37)-N6)-dimethylallyltransferase MiaA [Algicella marina]
MTSALPRPILIAGPTASGKSALALRMAEALNGIIVNTDALQVYDCWQVLTARPPAEDLARAPHRLYGHVGYAQPYSVGNWLREVERLLASDRPLIFVGGTGLYFQALTQGLAEIPATPAPVRAEGDALLAAEGLDVFRHYLAQHDPDLFARMDTQNPARLQRAWEVHRATGRALSAWQAETGPPLVAEDAALTLSLVSDPDWLGQRIDRRLGMMLEEGALEECRAILPRWQPSLPASRALGAAEFTAALRGELTLDDALARARTATRQYAKRQRTWFRSKMRSWHQVESESLTRKGRIEDIISMA